jgi:glycine betaine/proline transport system substrate-binding protein
MKRILIALVAITLVAGFGFAEGQQEGGGDQMEISGDLQLAYVEWNRCVAITHVAADILDRLGYNVNASSVANAAMWQSVAASDSDAHLCAWLPTTHQMFYGDEGRFTDQVVQAATNYQGARLGLVVPEYVDVNSIPELAQNAEQFNSEIVGIDPGAGMMQQTQTAIENDTSGLGEFNLLEGSGPTMVSALGDAINNEEPIVVTGWRPHIKFARFDLKILEDPEQIYGEAETINTIVRQNLESEMPQAYNFFANVDYQTLEQGVNAVMVDVNEGADPSDAAADWVSNNMSTVNSALPEGLSLQ